MSPSLLDNDAFRSYLNQRILCEVSTDQKRVALTFDDGPNPTSTPKLLDLLADRGVRATLFVVGSRVRRFPSIVERAANEGHEIGNHGYTHIPLSLMPRSLVRRELAVTGRLVHEITGAHPAFMRPPMGWFNRNVLRAAAALGYRPVVGSIHPQDSRKPGAGVIFERVRCRIEPGAIIILHDGGWRVGSDRSQTITALGHIIDELVARQFQVGPLGDLVGCAGAEPLPVLER